MKGKFALLLALMLFFGVFGVSVIAPSTKTIDGDPSDWTGTAGADNTWTVSAGEGIWRDIEGDDTGNGSYIYPNCTHSDPAIPDYAGGPDGNAYCYTGWPGGGKDPQGGMVDLREFRVTADSSNLYILLRFENMGSQAIAVEWNKDAHTPGSGANDTNFGKILAQIFIDKDRVPGSGRTDPSMNPWWGYSGNFLIDSSAAWEANIQVAGDVCRGYPRVELADGTTYYHNVSSDAYADCDIYPSAIEMKVPFSEIGDPRGKTWRFIVVAGGFDEGTWRQVWNKTRAIADGWPPLFKFLGGEGADWWAGGMGNDPNIIDMAFTASQAEQEALLDSFSSLVVVDKYRDVIFSSTGDVSTTLPVGGFISPLDKLALMTPWIALAVIAIAAVSVVYRRKSIPKTI